MVELTVRIAGDGVAGLNLARALGRDAVVHGDGGARAQTYVLVHRYAGRSFRTDALERDAWDAARPWLDELVAADCARRVSMVRPLGSAAGARLSKSRGAAPEVVQRAVAPFGECLVYEPAYVVDVQRALTYLARGVDVRAGRTADADVFATGVELAGGPIGAYGGDLLEVECDLEVAVSAAGVHVVPTPRGACIGSTWWPANEPQTIEEAHGALRRGAAALGIDIGDTIGSWRGVRAVNDLDRRPVVGTLGGRFVVGALGTRGWFWAPLLAMEAAAALTDARPVRPEVAAARLVT